MNGEDTARLVYYERADLFDHFPVVGAVDGRLSEVLEEPQEV